MSAAPRQYGFPGHSVAASPLMSLWHQAQAQRAARAARPAPGAGGAASPAGVALQPPPPAPFALAPRDGFGRQRLRFQRFVFLACGGLGIAVFALALAAQRYQDPPDEAAYVARCSSLYPLFAARHAAQLNASAAPHPPPRPPHPPRPPRAPAATPAPPPPPARQRDLYPGYSDFQRSGAQLCFASLVVGVCAFLVPLICGSCCACDGRRCCACVGHRALAALLCQILGWFGFGVFIANMAQAAAWQASITCGCTPGRAFVAVSATGVLSGTGSFLPATATSSSSDSSFSSDDYGPGGGCGGRRPALLNDLFITTFGALGLFSCAMSLGYFYLSTMQAALAAREAQMRMMPLLPTARRQLPPIIVAEPYGAPPGGDHNNQGGQGVEMARMVVVEEPGGSVCVGTSEPVQPPPPQLQPHYAQAPAGAAAQAAAEAAPQAAGAGPAAPRLPRGFRRARPPA